MNGEDSLVTEVKKTSGKMLNIGLLPEPAIPFLDTYPREIKTLVHTNSCT